MAANVSTEEQGNATRRVSLAQRSNWSERLAEGLVKGVALLSIAAVLLILVFVGKDALPVLLDPEVQKEVSFSSLFAPHAGSGYMWQPVSDIPKYNIVPLLLGTLKVSAISLLFAVPLSILSAIFVSELAGKRTREIVKPAIELLAGIPSVVVGFFALVVLAGWVQRVFGTEHRLNALVAGDAVTVEEVECLAACGGAPALQVNYEYHEHVTPQTAESIVDEYKSGVRTARTISGSRA